MTASTSAILGLESSGSRCSVALWRGGRVPARRPGAPPPRPAPAPLPLGRPTTAPARPGRAAARRFSGPAADRGRIAGRRRARRARGGAPRCGRPLRAGDAALPAAARRQRAACRRPDPRMTPRPTRRLAGALTVVVEPAGAAHLALLTALHGRCFTQGWSEATMASLLAIPRTFSLLATVLDNGAAQPAGFALARRAADESELLSIGVVPELQRRGIARRLVSACVERVTSAA